MVDKALSSLSDLPIEDFVKSERRVVAAFCSAAVPWSALLLDFEMECGKVLRLQARHCLNLQYFLFHFVRDHSFQLASYKTETNSLQENRTREIASKCAYTCADLPRFSPNFHTCAQLYHPIFG